VARPPNQHPLKKIPGQTISKDAHLPHSGAHDQPKIDTAESVSKDGLVLRQSPKNSPKKHKKKKVKRNYRISSHCGGKQVKRYGEQNAETASPDIGNPVIEVHTDSSFYTSFKYRDGSMADLSLELDDDESAKVFKVPVGQVAQVILHY
jgi:hypothetical protein